MSPAILAQTDNQDLISALTHKKEKAKKEQYEGQALLSPREKQVGPKTFLIFLRLPTGQRVCFSTHSRKKISWMRGFFTTADKNNTCGNDEKLSTREIKVVRAFYDASIFYFEFTTVEKFLSSWVIFNVNWPAEEWKLKVSAIGKNGNALVSVRKPGRSEKICFPSTFKTESSVS